MKRFFSLLIVSLAMAGCSEKPAEKPPAASSTPYGSPQEIIAYLQTIDPLVQQMGAIQREVDQATGSSGTATGKNLAPVMEKNRPLLQQVLANFEKITPPPLLAPFHEKIKKLMVTGLDAYGTITKGWQLEQEKDPQFETIYAQGKQKMAEAKTLSTELNGEMGKIQQALAQTQAPPQATTSR